jgi:NAD(P)-dependent dehydrogenase (short-subunit alcohol dehydrogenase family)
VTATDPRRTGRSARGYTPRITDQLARAGIARANPAEHVTEEDLDATLAVNLNGTFLTSQAAGRVMIGQGSGKIINIGSRRARSRCPENRSTA